MKQILTLSILIFITFGCVNSDENEILKEEIEALTLENKSLKSKISKKQELEEEAISIDITPKNYIKRKIKNTAIYIPELVTIEEVNVEYDDYDIMETYLNIKVKNGLNRKIKSILCKIESIDCEKNKVSLIPQIADIPANSIKNVKINLNTRLETPYIMKCYKHSPTVTISEALLETKERYLNIETID